MDVLEAAHRVGGDLAAEIPAFKEALEAATKERAGE